MQTYSSVDEAVCLSIPCKVSVHHKEAIGAGTVWALYPHRCHVESELTVSPGRAVFLSIPLPGTGRVRIAHGLVMWACGSEFGLQFTHGPVSLSHERSTL